MPFIVSLRSGGRGTEEHDSFRLPGEKISANEKHLPLRGQRILTADVR
jgi:hypothetical protein